MDLGENDETTKSNDIISTHLYHDPYPRKPLSFETTFSSESLVSVTAFPAAEENSTVPEAGVAAGPLRVPHCCVRCLAVHYGWQVCPYS